MRPTRFFAVLFALLALPEKERPKLMRAPPDEAASASDDIYPDGQTAVKAIETLRRDPQQPWKQAAFSQYARAGKDTGGKQLMGYSMRADRHRLTRWVDRRDPAKVEAVELYDHQDNPQENVNIAGDPKNAALVAQLTGQWLKGWRGATPAQP